MGLMTAYLAIDALIIIGLMCISAYLFMTRKFKYWEKRGITELPPTPFWGNFYDCIFLKKSPSEFVKDLYNRTKGLPYMGFYIFDKPFFLIRDPELVKHILVKDFSTFSDRHVAAAVTDRLGYTNLFVIKNPAWRILRTKITPIYTSGKLKKIFELMVEVAEDLADNLDSMNLDGDGKSLEMKDLSANFTTDLISTTAYGFKTNSMKNPNNEFRNFGRAIFTFDFWRSFEFLAIFFVPKLVKPLGFTFFGQKASQYLRSIFWTAINERMKSGVKRNDLIDLLIELREKHKDDEDLGGFRFEGDDLVAQAAVFFTGGFETSSTLMSFAFYELAKQQSIQAAVRKEITEALEETGGKITYDMMSKLPYLDTVLSETLRMYPPLGFLDRIATADYKVPNSDVIIEKGTPVFIPMLGMHYDPEYFPDPEKFDPDRFSEQNKKNRVPFTYFPFGDGPHVCIGQRIGLLQAKLGVIQVLRQYEILTNDKTPIPVKIDPKAVTTTAIGGLHVTLRKIHSAAG